MGQNGCDMIKLLIATEIKTLNMKSAFSYRKCKLLICRFWLFGIFVEKMLGEPFDKISLYGNTFIKMFVCCRYIK